MLPLFGRYWPGRNTGLLLEVLYTLECMEETLSNLDESVTGLKSAVTELANRIPSGDLVEQLKAAQEALAALRVEDEAAKASLRDALQDIAENVDEVDRVTNQVRSLGQSQDGGQEPTDPEQPSTPEDPQGTGSEADGDPGQEPGEFNPAARKAKRK